MNSASPTPHTSSRLRAILLLILTVIGLGILMAVHRYLGGKVDSAFFNLQAVLLAVLSVLDVVVLIVVLFVLSRYLVKTFFDTQREGRRRSVRTKLSLAFLLLSLAPVLLYLCFSYIIVSGSVRQWFSAPAETLLAQTRAIAREVYRLEVGRTTRFLSDYLAATDSGTVQAWDLAHFARDRGLDHVIVMDRVGRTRYVDHPSGEAFVPQDPALLLREARWGEPRAVVESRADADYVLVFARSKALGGLIPVFVQKIPGPVAYRAFLAGEAYLQYSQLRRQSEVIRLNYLAVVAFSAVILLFGSLWLGLFVAKRITVPVSALQEGARRVAAGDLSSPIACESHDEFEELVEAFNAMMTDLRAHRAAIESAQEDLRLINAELERNGTFIRSVLDTLATGVVSVGPDHVITISNAASRHLLKQRHITDGQTTLEDVLPGEKLQDILEILADTEFHPVVSREIVWEAGRRAMHFAVAATRMVGPGGDFSGYVVVFDDVTELLRAEKAAAWQEVARRLAHEIKNPLTPIQLSMERIRRQFRALEEGGGLPASPAVQRFSGILDEAFQTVAAETRTLKVLVDEFSQFARLPVPRFQAVDLPRLVREVVGTFREANPSVGFRTELAEVPLLRADPDLLRRVLVNLMDNALDALEAVEGERAIEVGVWSKGTSSRVQMVVEDTGPGVDEAMRDRLFEPYVSSKASGMGLGLSIVKKILADHGARIRVEEGTLGGARFVLEFRDLWRGGGDDFSS